MGKSLSEYQFAMDDAAHYVVLLLPDDVRFVFLLAADCESRLFLVCSTNTRGEVLAQMQRDLLLKRLQRFALSLNAKQLLRAQQVLHLLAEQRLQELSRVVEQLDLSGDLSTVQNPNLLLSGGGKTDQLVRAIQNREVLHVLRATERERAIPASS